MVLIDMQVVFECRQSGEHNNQTAQVGSMISTAHTQGSLLHNNITPSITLVRIVTYSWMFNDGPLPMNSLVSESDTSSLLTLFTVENGNTGAYTCTANSADRDVVNDDTAYVEVVGE